MNRESIQVTAKIIASDTDALYDIAKSKGITMPHPSLGIFKSVLCEIEKPNANGIRLGKKATEVAVSTLIGCQVNRNHLRAGNVMGHIIDASINKDKEIEICCIFFKDIYEEDYADAMELFKKNKLTMSFELSADVESQDKLADGTKRLNDYYFTGAGLLFGVKPACKKARVFEIASRKLYNQLSMERQSLIFANNQNTQNSILGVLIKVTEQAKKIDETQATEVVETPTLENVVVESTKVEEVKIETPEVKVEEAQKVCPECNEPMKDDECAVCKNKKASEEVEVETPVVESPKVEEVVEAQPVVETVKVEDRVVVTETVQKVTDTISENSETIKVETEVTLSVNDQVKEERKEVVEVTYTYAQVEEIKASYEKQVSELKEKLVAKDAEIVSIKATSETLASRKIELANNEFVKDFTDSDYLDDVKVENAKLKLEAAKKEQIQAEEKPVILATGHKTVVASIGEESAIVKILRNKRLNRK